MRTDKECLACFHKQALATARLSTSDTNTHRLVIEETDRLLARLDMSLSPPENAVAVYQQIAELTGVNDPFKELKSESNAFALELSSKIREQIDIAADSLFTSVRYAIAGNIIDYGAQHTFDAVKTLSRCLEKDLCIDDFSKLRKDVDGGEKKNILYLADNSGEIVFDGLLVEQLLKLGHKVVLAVRGVEILNDVTFQEAIEVGLTDLCTVISNGTSCPGTPIHSCSDELKKGFYGADLIISKGQGNFETLSEVKAPIYFLLTVKCRVVARHIAALKSIPSERINGCGEMILMKMEERNADTTD
jgi:uncharacterized protein with ATP-grasp and redox domains